MRFYLLAALWLFSLRLYAQEASLPPAEVVITNPTAARSMFVSLNLSLSTRKATEDNQLIIYYVDQDKRSYRINTQVGYFFKNDLAAGISMGYTQTSEDNISLDPDGLQLRNRIFSNGYGISPFLRNYISLDKGKRFFLVNETQLLFVFSNRIKETLDTQDLLTRTFTRTQEYGIGMRPGIVVMVQKNFAFETTVGAMGLTFESSRVTQTDKPQGTVFSSDLNLKIDILQINLGFAYYF